MIEPLADLRYSFRALRRNPGFAAVSVLTLALGIGATSAIFSVVDRTLMRPLPFASPDRLVQVQAWSGENPTAFSGPAFLDYRGRTKTLTHVASYRSEAFRMRNESGAELLEGLLVSASYFDVFGVPAAIGRTFSANDGETGPVAVISHALWQRLFGAATDAVGRTIVLNNEPMLVVAVMPRSFSPPEGGDLWVRLPGDVPRAIALSGMADLERNRAMQYLSLVGRRAPNRTLEQARTDASQIAAALSTEYPETDDNRQMRVVPLREAMFGELRTPLLVLLGAVGVVLLIACANIANLLLARATAREREVAVRASLGAKRSRIVRQLLTETLVLGFVGAGLGVLLATWLLEAFGSIRPEGLPADTAGVDLRVIAFAAALATLTGTGFGIYPALRATRLDLASVLKAQGRGNTDTRGRAVRGSLVVAQLALSIVLLIGAGLLLRSFIALHATESGVRTAGVLTAQVPLPQPAYAQAERQLTFYAQLLERVRALPGVEAAGAAFPLPFTASGGATEVRREEDTDSAANTPRVSLNWATPGFFEAIGQPILSGRGFDESDREGSLRTVIINRTLARLLWPDADPMGKRLRVGGGPDADYATVVGVVGDVRRRGLHLPPGPEAYLPLAQNAMPFMSLVLRVRGNPERIASALRAETATLDPGLPLGDVSTVEQLIANSVADRRLRTVLLGSFAGLALLLAVVGVYGVLSYSVAQRSRELGIRMALGGTASGIIGLVLRDTAGMVVAGVVIGLLGALAVSRVLANLLYGVGTTDPVTFIVVPAVLVAAALIASWIPARRASRADPLVVLRAE